MIKKKILKTHILFDFKQKSGGGNQFLKALKFFLESQEAYSEEPERADIILFNSHQHAEKLLKFKKKFKEKIFVHRVDGPIKLYSSENDRRDDIVYLLNDLIADATIYQSKWSFKQNKKLGIASNKNEITIINAPDTSIFNRKNKNPNRSKKTRLIATSWSKNLKKGFKDYKWLDNNLDFNYYKMFFVGNSSVKFNNIIHLPAMNSEELSRELKKSDIYITASQNDPCSNSLIEALHCGLPAVYLNQGGHPEIVKKAGLYFNKVEEVPLLIRKIEKEYTNYVNKISLPTFNEVGGEYLSFLYKIHKHLDMRKNLNTIKTIKVLFILFSFKCQDYLKTRLK